MSTAIEHNRIPEAIPIDFDPPRIIPLPPRAPEVVPPGDPGAPPSAGMRPVQYLKHRWATVLFLGAFLGAIFAGAAYALIPAKYTTYSIIRVAPQDPKLYYNEDPQGRNDFSSYLKTQAGMLKSHFVLNAALRDPEIAALPMLQQQQDPVRYLEEELIIEFSDGSELIKPKLSGNDPKAITNIINAIHKAYFREIVDAERRRKNTRLTEIETTITAMQTDLDKKLKQPGKDDPEEKKAEAIPGVGPNVAANQIARLRERIDNNTLRLLQIAEERKRLEKRLENPEGELGAVPQGYIAQLEGDPAIVGINRQLATWQKQYNYFKELNSDENNPGLKELRAKMSEATQEKERIRKERIEEFRKATFDETIRKLKADDEKLDAEAKNIAFFQEKLEKDVKEYESKLMAILPPTDGPRDFNKVDTKSRSDIISGLMEKANLLKLEVKAPSRVTSFQEAAVPMKRDTKKQYIGTAAGALMGFLLVGLGVVAYESRVKRVMSLKDVQTATLGPVLGTIPVLKSFSGVPTLEMALAEEAIEKSRANILQQFGRTTNRAIVLTSALGDEGHPFMAREMALSFARAGHSTLLVDFDLRTPSLHLDFDLPNDYGFSDVLAGQLELERAVHALPWGLGVLTAGPLTDVARQNLSAQRLDEVISLCRSVYEIVIINTHPVLTVTETMHAARASDAVILTIDRHQSRLPMVTKAQEKIASLAPEAFGVVYIGATKEECWN